MIAAITEGAYRLRTADWAATEIYQAFQHLIEIYGTENDMCSVLMWIRRLSVTSLERGKSWARMPRILPRGHLDSSKASSTSKVMTTKEKTTSSPPKSLRKSNKPDLRNQLSNKQVNGDIAVLVRTSSLEKGDNPMEREEIFLDGDDQGISSGVI